MVSCPSKSAYSIGESGLVFPYCKLVNNCPTAAYYIALLQTRRCFGRHTDRATHQQCHRRRFLRPSAAGGISTYPREGSAYAARQGNQRHRVSRRVRLDMTNRFKGHPDLHRFGLEAR